MFVNLFEIANDGTALLAALNDVIAQAPFRHMITQGLVDAGRWRSYTRVRVSAHVPANSSGSADESEGMFMQTPTVAS